MKPTISATVCLGEHANHISPQNKKSNKRLLAYVRSIKTFNDKKTFHFQILITVILKNLQLLNEHALILAEKNIVD